MTTKKTKSTNNNDLSKTLIIIGAILWGVLKIFSMIFAGYLAWSCFSKDMQPVRVFKTVLCTSFSFTYLLILFIRIILLRQPC